MQSSEWKWFSRDTLAEVQRILKFNALTAVDAAICPQGGVILLAKPTHTITHTSQEAPNGKA
jgi:hypothetical protein